MNNFAIVSDNCWGTLVYQNLNKQYNSPFINLFIHTSDYIKLLENFFEYLKEDLNFIKFSESKYANDPYNTPIVGKLKDIEIYFAHKYNNEEDVYNKWNKRKDRIPKNEKDILFKLGTIYTIDYIKYDNFDWLVNKFHSLNLTNKVSFTFKKYKYSNNFQILNEHKGRCDLKGKEIYKYFDINKWINERKIYGN